MRPKTYLAQRGGRLRVLALTGIRSEYDLLYPLLDGMRRDPAFDVGVIVTGAHLTPLHRHSVRQIEADGFEIRARIRSLVLAKESNAITERVRSCARLLRGLADVLEREHPDLLLYLGDREEPLVGGTAANYMGVPAVHVAGGDAAHPDGGDVDEEARHAATKLSHVHLTMAEPHTRRVLRLGEEPWRVKTVGNPGLDRLRLESALPLNRLIDAVGDVAARDFVIVLYHPVSSTLNASAREVELCLQQSLDAGLDVCVGAPNSDPGCRDILAVIKRYQRHPRVHAYGNLPRSEFAALLRRARAIVGNSSLGLLEASFIGLPCVNVGQRQRGRLAGINVQFVEAEARAVRRALHRALFDGAYRARVRRAHSPYGDGHTVARALRFLKALPPRERLLAKRITY